jgi:hypothetical protein
MICNWNYFSISIITRAIAASCFADRHSISSKVNRFFVYKTATATILVFAKFDFCHVAVMQPHATKFAFKFDLLTCSKAITFCSFGEFSWKSFFSGQNPHFWGTVIPKPKDIRSYCRKGTPSHQSNHIAETPPVN